MESSNQLGFTVVRMSVRRILLRVTLALGAAILFGLLIYLAFVVFVWPQSFNGARVNGFNTGGPAEEAGIVPDDVITHVNGIQLSSLTQFGQLITDSSGEKMNWLVERHGVTMRFEVLPDTEDVSSQGRVGVYLSDRYKGRKEMILDLLPVAYVGAGFLIFGLIIGLQVRRSQRRNSTNLSS